MMKRIISYLLPVLLCGTTAEAQKITVQLDLESATALVDLLSKNATTDETLAHTAQLYGNRQLIQKVKNYSGADSAVFTRTLKEVIEKGKVQGSDPFAWNTAKQALPELQALLKAINQSPTAFGTEVAEMIAPYTPQDLQLEARACFLVGGGALGFTLGDDPTFNVALHTIGGDLEGLKTLIAHELYHNVQSAGYALRKIVNPDEKPSFNERAAYSLLTELWAEGSATFVGDFSKVKSNAPFSVTQKENYSRNRNRLRTSFYLLETVLYQAYHDPEANYEQLYNIGFTTEFEEVFYGVGYEIARQLVAHHGPAELADLVVADPLDFMEKYIHLYRSYPEKRLVKFSAGTELIVGKLKKWKDKM